MIAESFDSRTLANMEVALDRALEPQRLFDEVGDAVARRAQAVLELGVFTEQLERRREETHGRLLPGREEIRRDANDVDHLGE